MCARATTALSDWTAEVADLWTDGMAVERILQLKLLAKVCIVGLGASVTTNGASSLLQP